ncbi:MAG: VWA domain-containing protein, partial [Gemmatimonadetes bacterium]|nr:VWA domain-containing protein [Gemmatimonadota bacterium]
MQFLAPLFLAAAAAVAIPVILHLIQREKREAIPFPSLMFLSRIPHKATRRRRLRDLPLLVLRVLALVLLAAAFARPLLRRDAGARVAASPARELVLLLDRSYSMRAGDHWERAVAAARAEIARLGPADRMSIVAFDDGAGVAASSTADRAVLRAALDGLEPGWSGTRYDPALRLAGNLLASSPLPRREVVLISDYQRAGLGDGLETRLPAGVELRTVALTGGGAPNLAVAGVTFRREQFGGQERVTATARIVNTSGEAVPDRAAALLLDGRTLHTLPVSVPPHGAVTLSFPAFTLSRAVRGEVRLTGDALAADDAQYFALAPGQAIDVVAVEGRAGASLYVASALGVGGEPGFRVTVRRAPGGEPAGTDVVLLN